MSFLNRISPSWRCVVLSFALVLFVPGLLTAQTNSNKDWNHQKDTMKSAIGLHYGNLAGNGVSFRFPIKWWLYAQVGGGIWHVSDDEKHNLGFELNYILRQDDKVRLYLGAGTGYFYHRELVSESGEDEVWNKNQDWNVGGGVGLEYLVGTRWAVQGELDFVHIGESGDIKVAPQLGVHYYW